MGMSTRLPIAADIIALWISQSRFTLAHASIRAYTSSVRSLHQKHQYDDPTDSNIVKRALRAFRRWRAMQNNITSPSLTVTPQLVIMMAQHLDLTDYDHIMILAALHTGTAALLRVGEFALASSSDRVLRLSHLRKHHKAGYFLQLDGSKTDQYRAGQRAYISTPISIEALERYLNVRPPSSPDEALFKFKDGRLLTRSALHKYAKTLLARVPGIGAHRGLSFRAGGATALADAGVRAEMIKVAGRWKSAASERYTRPSIDTMMSATAVMNMTSQLPPNLIPNYTPSLTT